jgi:alpha-tubulin suppressor-like RCC1 family protein
LTGHADESCRARGRRRASRPGHRAPIAGPRWHARARGVAGLLALALLASALPATAGAHRRARSHARGITLALPASAFAGARVQATGAVGGPRRGRRVVLQNLSGRRWRALRVATLSRGRYAAGFLAPRTARVLRLRAVLYRHRRAVRVSRVRRLTIVARRPAPAARPPVGNAAGWGGNSHWQLGAGFKNNFSAAPVPVQGLVGIKQVAATYFSSYALMEDGTVRAWGGNTFGQLGNGARSDWSPTPVRVAGLTDVRAIAAGGAHAMALLGNGTVATWGGNDFGTLGNGTSAKGRETTAGSPSPVIVPGLSNVVAIAAGGADDAALLADGTVMAWGENKQGQLGDGTTVEKPTPTRVLGLSGVRAIAVGGIPSQGTHMLALLADGTVMAAGGNGAGQLGNGSTTNSSVPVKVAGLSGVRAVAASSTHSLALLEDGSVMAWGDDASGELGVPAPQSCGGTTPAPCSRVPVAVGLRGVSAIAAGWRFSLALSGGAVSAWGANDLGQLGDATTTASAQPVPVSGLAGVAGISAGETHSLALLAAGPAAPVEVHAGPGSLTITWTAAATSEPWTISWRPVAHPAVAWGRYVPLAPATRSYTITGLASGLPYEAVVRSKGFGSKIVSGVPG